MTVSVKKISLVSFAVIVIALIGYALSAPSANVSKAPTDKFKDPIPVKKPHYVGAQACAQCHRAEYVQWTDSDHARAMQVATSESVLGNFSGSSAEFHAINSRFYQQDGAFLIDSAGDSGEQTFRVSYTFGHYPLQQYLIELANGHIQAFDVAWDSRPKQQGGQRWFHLQPGENITPEHPFFWTRHFQNWNSRCADCHSTHVQLNYDAGRHSYNTQWSEINVACEACHGPASKHIKQANSASYSNNDSGFAINLKNNNHFVFDGSGSIAKNGGGASTDQLNSCAGCHSRRLQIAPVDATRNYHDQFALSTLDENLYFADGQIQDEVFVVGSFLQSKMHQAGVTCSNCHNPHSGKVKVEGNGLCLQCHKADTYDVPAHHRHQPDSTGAICVTCHMPERTYMGVDGRRDHGFSIPRPALAAKVQATSACSTCHSNWSAEQTISRYQQLFGTEPTDVWAEANWQARQGNTLALNSIFAVANDQAIPAIRRATLMRQGIKFPAQVTLDALRIGLSDPSPLVRAAAVESLGFVPPAQRVELLVPLINDRAKVVRMAVANQLVGAMSPSQAAVQKLFDEYEQSLLLTQDQPATQINLGSFYQRQGDSVRAKQAFEQALLIEPAFVPGLINLADMYRAEGNDDQARQFLNRAVVVAPDSAAVHYALGLLEVRQKNMEQALLRLETAATIATAEPTYAYTYAIALESTGHINKAIEVLVNADKRWPNNPDLLMTLAVYLDRAGGKYEILPVLSRLSRVMPGNPDVQRLVKKHSR